MLRYFPQASSGRFDFAETILKLTKLHPRFVRYESRIETWSVIDGDPATWRERGTPTREVTGPRQYLTSVEKLDQAQGITFLCPKCFAQNDGEIGTHGCEVTFENREVQPDHGSQGSDGQPTRWTVSGTGLEDLTTLPSILLIGGCGWHGYITNGEAA